MIEVSRFLTEIDFFVEQLDVKKPLVNLISGWEIPENSSQDYTFLKLESVTVNPDIVTLADLVELNVDKIKTGEEVVVILADNRNHSTKMEFFKCNIEKGSELTPSQIVAQSDVKFFEGENYYDEEIL